MSSSNALKTALAVALFAVFGAFAPAANANSALDQYVEEVPNTTGNHDPDKNVDQNKDENQAAKVDRDRSRQLEAQGEEGQNLLAVANDTGSGGNGPTAPKAEHAANHKDHDAAASRDRAETKGPGAAKSLKAAADASGINAPLFIFVVLLAVAMGATAWMRRGRGAQHS
jgi:hypothetical protein